MNQVYLGSTAGDARMFYDPDPARVRQLIRDFGFQRIDRTTFLRLKADEATQWMTTRLD